MATVDARYENLDQYSLFPEDALIVQETRYDGAGNVIYAQEIDDYSIADSGTGEEIKAGNVLKKSGILTLEVYKDGCESAFVDIEVRKVRDFTEKLLVTTYPKTEYAPGEKIDLSGMVLSLSLSYRDSDNRKVEKEEEVQDFSLLVDGKEMGDYTFESYGNVLVEVTCPGRLKTLSTTFLLQCLREIEGPKSYPDKTIETVVDETTMTVHITNAEREDNVDPLGIDTEGKGYYSPDEVKVAQTYYDYGERNVYGWKFAPSHPLEGERWKTPLLVVPVIVPGYGRLADEETLDTIEKAFFGNSADLAFESLRSYYYKSSHGKLEITGVVTDYFDPMKDSDFYHDVESLQEGDVPRLAQECADWAKETYGLDLSRYDSDGDGLIDMMWMVYVSDFIDSNSAYWAFSTSTGNAPDPDREEPVVNNLGWAGIGFLRDFSPDNPDCDAHVLIHETGHLLGLNDYYSYSGMGYSPLGGIDMMDNNVGDHNPYSKMLLGWATPYVVYGNDVTITLPSSAIEDAFIVLPYEGKTYRVDEESGKVLFNPFDEYLILDLYSDAGKLRGMDYEGYGAHVVDGVGGRLYHVDARLGLYDPEDGSFAIPEDPDSLLDEAYDGRVVQVISNSEEGSYSEEGFGLPFFGKYDEIRWITKDRKKVSLSDRPTSSSLFKEGDAFLFKNYRTQFVNGSFDCGKDFAYDFVVESLV